MRRSVTLEKSEIDRAIYDYVESKMGFRPDSISLHFTPGDRPFDVDHWTATANETRAARGD